MAFPDSIESFQNAQNVTASEATDVNLYSNAMDSSDIGGAADVLDRLSEQKIVNADQLNQYQPTINRVKAYADGASTQMVTLGTNSPTTPISGDFWWDTSVQLYPPNISNRYNYTGSVINVLEKYSTDGLTVDGTTSATNLGSYTFTLTPNVGYGWSDGTTTAKSYTWQIVKAKPTFTLSAYSLVLNTQTKSMVVTVTTNSTGAVSASSSNPSIATASVSGKSVTITGIANGSATVTISVAETTNYLSASATVAVTASFAHIYGAYWDGTSTTRWTRTDDSANFANPEPYIAGASSYSSPFDNLYPWSGMVRSTHAQAGEVVAIPKFWYKWTFGEQTNSIRLQIADAPVDGFYVSPTHADRGDGKGERDVVYIGRYHCISNYKSISGATPITNRNIATFRSGIHNLGSTIWQNDYATRVTIWMLYLVEFADWNSQAKIGYGCSTSVDYMTMGYTDSMPYHTGTITSSRTTYGGTQYRYIEGLWDNVYDWCDGIQFDSGTIYIAMNPDDFGTNKTNTGFTRYLSNGYISSFGHSTVSGLEWCIYTNGASGSQSTYITDHYYYASGVRVLCVGGNYRNLQNYGLFYLSGNNTSPDPNSYIGSRLLVLP